MMWVRANLICGYDVSGDGNDSNNVDAVDDGSDVNINGGDDANCVNGEIIVNCDDKGGADDGDNIDGGGVGTDGGSDRDFEDDKTKVDCSEDTSGDDGISNDDDGPNDSGCVDTNDNDFGGDGTDSDGDNNDNNGVDVDKNDGDGNDADGVSNNEGGDNADSDDKDGARDYVDNKDHIEFKSNDQEFLEINFIKVFTTYGANLSFPDSIRCK